MSMDGKAEAEAEMGRLLTRWNLGVFAAPRAGWAKGFAGGPSHQGETPDGPLRRASLIPIRLVCFTLPKLIACRVCRWLDLPISDLNSIYHILSSLV